MRVEPIRITPDQYYRRQIPGADFVLVANTDDAPQPGRFYVLRGGATVYSGPDFDEALAAYRELALAHWEKRMKADDPETSLNAAEGLLDLNPRHGPALEVVQRLGDAALLKRLEQRRKKDQARRRQEAMAARRKASSAKSQPASLETAPR